MHAQQFQIKENARRGSSSLLDRLAEDEEFRGRKSQFVAQMIPRSGKWRLAICAAARASAVEKKRSSRHSKILKQEPSPWQDRVQGPAGSLTSAANRA